MTRPRRLWTVIRPDGAELPAWRRARRAMIVDGWNVMLRELGGWQYAYAKGYRLSQVPA